MAKTTQELLTELQEEASEIRDDNSSVKSGIVKKGEDTVPSPEEDTDEQDIDTEEGQPDEESEPEKTTEEPDTSEREERTAAFRERALRRVIEQERKTNSKRVTELEGKIQEFQTAQTKTEQKEIGTEISELATELKLDPAGLEKIFDKFSSLMERKIQPKLPSEDLYRDFEERKEREYFDTEWNEPKVQGFIEREYPKATARQLEEAKVFLDELAHDAEIGGNIVKDSSGKERLAGYPLDYLIMTHKEDFDSILSNKKRHGLESASRASADDTTEESDTSTAKGLEALDKKYARASIEASDLHRVRPSSRGI